MLHGYCLTAAATGALQGRPARSRAAIAESWCPWTPGRWTRCGGRRSRRWLRWSADA